MNKRLMNFEDRARRVRTAGMLSAHEERELLRAWQDFGDRRARDRLVLAFAPLAASVAKRFGPRSGEADPDLVQQANLGLMKAADRFDLDRDLRFSTYAVWWVRAEVQAYLRANMSVVRRPNSAQTRNAAAKIAALDAEKWADGGVDSAGADARLADALGVNAERAAALRVQLAGRDHSLNMPAIGDTGEDRIALLVDPATLDQPVPLREMETATLRRVLMEALSTLPDRERHIVLATQVRDPPATLEGLGAQYGISRERVRQLRERGFERLRLAIRKRDLGVDSFL